MASLLLAEQSFSANIGWVTANDAQRSSFSVVCGNELLAVDGNDLRVLHRWPHRDAKRGCHASIPKEGLALISGPESVSLLDCDGNNVWSHTHPPWENYQSGCTWFDANQSAFAVVPTSTNELCEVIHFERLTGAVLYRVGIEADPNGILPIHHLDGTVCLSEGEGQDAVKAFWIAPLQPDGKVFTVFNPGWTNWIMCDVSASCDRVAGISHAGDELSVYSFPALRLLLKLSSPHKEAQWDSSALCFVGEQLFARTIGDEQKNMTVSVSGKIKSLELPDSFCRVSGVRESWIDIHQNRLERRCLSLEGDADLFA